MDRNQEKEYHKTASADNETQQAIGSASGPYYYQIRQQLEVKRQKLIMELQLIEDTISRITPEIENTLIVAKALDQLGMRTRY